METVSKRKRSLKNCGKSRKGEKEKKMVDGFLRFSSLRVSWIWRIQLVCSLPRAPRLPTVPSFCFSFSPFLLLERFEPRNRAERNELPASPARRMLRLSRRRDWVKTRQQVEDENEKEKEVEKTYGSVVRNTCLREPFLSVSLLRWPSVYKRQSEDNDVLPPVTVYLLSSNFFAYLFFSVCFWWQHRRCRRRFKEISK